MISEKQAYEWVKTGHWSLRQFREWVDALNTQERKEFAAHAVDIARKAVEEEREACAKVCEKLMTGLTPIGDTARQDCAEAIRARGETK